MRIALKTALWETTDPKEWRTKYEQLIWATQTLAIAHTGYAIYANQKLLAIVNLTIIFTTILMIWTKRKWEKKQREKHF